MYNEIPLKEIYILVLKELRKQYDEKDIYYIALTYAIERIEMER